MRPFVAPILLTLATLAIHASAQDVRVHVQRLAAQEPEQREDARRRLALVPRAELPVDALVQHVTSNGVAAAPAVAILALHADLHAAVRRQIDVPRASATLLDAALPLLSVGDLWQIAMSARRSNGRLAERALAELAQRGELLVGSIAELLADGDASGPAAFAAELIAHGELPPPLVLAAIAADATARQRVLRALADHPREDFVPWFLPWLEGDDATATLLALAALPPSQQTAAHARLALRLLSAETAPFLPDLAASRFSPKIADGLVAAAHGALIAGHKITDLLPMLRSVSTAGEAHLLGLAMTLGTDDREEVLRWLDTRDSALLKERVGAALDSAAPLDECFLRRAGPHLTSAARVARVVSELKISELKISDLKNDEPRRGAAFTALIEADRFDVEMLRMARQEPEPEVARTRELLRLSRGVLPIDTAREFLAHRDASVRLSAVHYLAIPGMEEATEIAFAALLGSDDDDRVRAACARALSALGTDARAEAAFAFAFGSAYGDEAVEWLIERPRPFGLALLRTVRAGERTPREIDELDTGRVRLGDAAPLAGLIDRIATLPTRLVKRMGPALRGLDDAQLVAKVRAAAANADVIESVREPLIEALAAQPLRHVEFLQQTYQREEDDGIRLAALHGLLQTPAGATLLADLNAAIGQRPLRASDEDMAFEVLGAATMPLTLTVVEFAARLVLLAPLANPVAEAELAISDRSEGTDYPLVQPLCELIRRDPQREHGEVIARVLAEARAHRNAHALSRRRLGHLLGYLTLAEPTFLAVAPALARAIVEAPDRDARWLGPAWGLIARDTEAKGDLEAAAAAYARARDGFLHRPPPTVQRRRFVLDPDPARGIVPMGELAARSHLLRARLLLTQGDRDAARAALAVARSRASADALTLAEVAALATQVEGK